MYRRNPTRIELRMDDVLECENFLKENSEKNRIKESFDLDKSKPSSSSSTVPELQDSGRVKEKRSAQ